MDDKWAEQTVAERALDAAVPNIGDNEAPLFQCHHCLRTAQARGDVEHVPYCRIGGPPESEDAEEREDEHRDVSGIFYGAPELEGDPRQALFGKALDQILEEEDGEEVAIIGLVGFPAASVNVGWLQQRLVEYWWRDRPEPEDAIRDVQMAVSCVVQRAKQVQVGLTPTHIDVLLVTKDDHGWYEYRFSAYIARDERDDSHLRVVGSVGDRNCGEAKP